MLKKILVFKPIKRFWDLLNLTIFNQSKTMDTKIVKVCSLTMINIQLNFSENPIGNCKLCFSDFDNQRIG